MKHSHISRFCEPELPFTDEASKLNALKRFLTRGDECERLLAVLPNPSPIRDNFDRAEDNRCIVEL